MKRATSEPLLYNVYDRTLRQKGDLPSSSPSYRSGFLSKMDVSHDPTLSTQACA